MLAALLSLAACLTVSGCGEGDTQPVKLDGQCGFAAQITSDGQSFEASFLRDKDGGWTAVFSSPDSLSEMTVTAFTAGGDSVLVQYQGLSLEMSADKLPAGSVASAIEQCMDHAANSSAVKYSKDGDLKLIKGQSGCGEYELRVTHSGEPVSLYIGSDIAAEFSGFERAQ